MLFLCPLTRTPGKTVTWLWVGVKFAVPYRLFIYSTVIPLPWYSCNSEESQSRDSRFCKSKSCLLWQDALLHTNWNGARTDGTESLNWNTQNLWLQIKNLYFFAIFGQYASQFPSKWHVMGIYIVQQLHIFPLSLETWCSKPLWDGKSSIIFSSSYTHAKRENYVFAMLTHHVTAPFSLQKSSLRLSRPGQRNT